MDTSVQELYDILQIPTDVTVRKDGISFSMPTWMLKENASYEDYKNLLDKWLTRIKRKQNYGRTGELSRLCKQENRRNYERIRFRSADNAFSEKEDTRDNTSFRDNYLSEGRLSQESKGILSAEEAVSILG